MQSGCVSALLAWRTYRVRIGRLVVKWKDKGLEGKREQKSFESKVWFLGLVTTVLLIVAGVQLNPAPQVELAKINQILSYVKIRRSTVMQ